MVFPSIRLGTLRVRPGVRRGKHQHLQTVSFGDGDDILIATMISY